VTRGLPGRDLPIGGRRAVAEAIRGGRARRVLIAADATATEGLRSVRDSAERTGIPLTPVDRSALDRLPVVDHQGVVAFVRQPEELDEPGLLRLADDMNGLVVVLDGVTDPQNFGAAARSAESAGVTAMVTRSRRSAPLSAAAIRASAGALLLVPVARVPNLTRALEHLKDLRYTVVGLDHRADRTIHDDPPPDLPLALVLGAEDVGMSRLVRETCDVVIAIPMAGRMASLNVAAALAVALFGYALRPR
jgi:23S rRNA (guanosine2251-2'-O)-methyltransferase